MNIRKATSPDHEKISLIFREEYCKSPYNEKWTKESASNKIKEYFNKSFILVAEESKEVIGFIIFNEFVWDDGPRVLINEIVVTEKFQRQGIGKRLIEEVEKYSKTNGKKGISLLAHKEAKSINFYKKQGFKEGELVLFDKKIK